jgi:diaminopimelate decarboxylase
MKQFFPVSGNQLHVEAVPMTDIAARFGTPTYVYSKAALMTAYRRLDTAFAERRHLICYALKANSSLALLNLLARLGAGFDIVSGGELKRVIAAGGDPRKTVFSGVGKSVAELRFALDADVLCFNVESESELKRLDRIAGEAGKVAPVSFRVNPDVDAKTHPYISTGLKASKFGVAFDKALQLYRAANALPNIRIIGIDCHIGSQIVEMAPLREALQRMLSLVDRLAAEGIRINHIDVGGGLGISYRDETPPPFEEYAQALLGVLAGREEMLILEPGRALVGNAGVLLTRVEYLKHGETKNFAIVDAAMNDLLRPALYDAYHAIREVIAGSAPKQRYDVVGPVCESADFLGLDRDLALSEGDLLAIMNAGAYSAAMSSNYNSRGRAAEVLVDGEQMHLIAEREAIDAVFARERIIDSLKI